MVSCVNVDQVHLVEQYIKPNAVNQMCNELGCCVFFSLTSLNPKIVSIGQTHISTRSYKVLYKWTYYIKLTYLSNWILLKLKYDNVPFFVVFSYVWCDSPVECHRCLNFTLITLSLMGTSSLDRQPRLEYLKCLICVSSEKAGDPCSSSLSFRVLSLEAACSCPRLFTAGGIHTGRRGAKPSVFEQQVVIQSCCLLYVPLYNKCLKQGFQQIAFFIIVFCP